MTRLIKKYKNRRLYDMDNSQYITLEDLKQYVLKGYDFRVEDSTTGNDITNAILLQILVETQAAPTQFLSSTLLRQLINLAHHPMQQTVDRLLQDTIGFIEKQMRINPYWHDYQKASDEWAKQSSQFLAKWQELFKG
ncbi:polyhydroxyalkanoate synthesis regulator DNA-binding domain-containing protein [Legionella londiniensis]|uniref:Putative Polyhydroxyalkanoate synthesis repressor PhaR n=1 Tax=Legionella londiniensis TaxID=45068 RepID=A0A0W0VHR0_9GAMM|nr:polyhydroxyalkanoate synthesis regulator DNA-binding domain-containing protein [Legionella londiniensis]KTD19650.1 putative Polyhydroxyalkanoate synthesis repressor PhaR [Legionella londiniensis]STX92440.1 putative Polyhydroxyalkanoate synthesis repressor PhaR [Legionella londiniensis]